MMDKVSGTVRKDSLHPIHKAIRAHPAWCGRISGLAADRLLRYRKTPFLYVLRGGELESGSGTDYYVSFLLPDLTIRHHPFVITTTPEGWYYDDTTTGGPYADASIENILHLMMHCQQKDCVPLQSLKMK